MRICAVIGTIFLCHNCLVATAPLVHPNAELPVPQIGFRITDAQLNEAVGLLGKMVAIPSISNPNSPDYKFEHLQIAAQFVAGQLRDLGCEVAYPSIEGSPPFVMAQLGADPAKPTLLLYAHYDVQPVDREMWLSDPFIMQEREGRLYGRGASDDKAGIAAIITALKAYLKSFSELPVNIKLLFEGEEEYGSSHMRAFLEQNSQYLQSDALVVLDGRNRDMHIGTLTCATRGIVTIKLKVNALEKPVHSGSGCLAPDPAQALAGLIYALREPKNIPGFLDSILPLSDQERDILAKNSLSAESYAKEMHVIKTARLRGDPKESIYERIAHEPSISVINMQCGQPNGGNSIQDSATCMIGVRILPGQDPDRVAKIVMDHLQSQAILYDLPIEMSLVTKGSWAWKAELTRPFSQKYLEALGENFASSAAMPTGGAFPLLREFQEKFPAMEMIVAGIEDPHTSAHSHNESQDRAVFRNAINTLIAFMHKAGTK